MEVDYLTSIEMVHAIAKPLNGKKAQDVTALEIKDLTTIGDYFVGASGSSPIQVKAMSDACEEAAEAQGERVHHIEGHGDGTWLLMDFSSVVVHVFTEEARKFYDLERLWSDAQEIDLSEVLPKE